MALPTDVPIFGDSMEVSSGKGLSPEGFGFMGGLAGAGLGLVGDFFSAKFASNERKHAEQRMLDMDNTKHFREVRDLRRAGLNPILSAKGAASAGSVPGPAPVPDLGGTVSKGLSSGLQLAMLKANLDNVNADTQSKQAGAVLTAKTAANLPAVPMAQARQTAELSEIHARIKDITQAVESKELTNEKARIELEYLRNNRDMLTAIYAPTAYERAQIDKLFEGDFSPSTAIKLFLEFIRSR